MKICIIGAFGFEMIEMATGGQPVKTRELYALLKEFMAEYSIVCCDTYEWKKRPFGFLLSVKKAIKQSDIIIMLPANNGVKILSRILIRYKKNRRLIYDVIGGWLPDILKDDPALVHILKQFDGVWVETNNMKNALERLGFQNITVIPNFKKLNIVDISSIKAQQLCIEKPFRLCTFSRVMKEKGIEDVIKAVTEINENLGDTIFILDIYGPVDKNYRIRFDTMKESFPSYIRYCGVCNPNRSVDTIKYYTALLFSTYYDGEGFAGTLIDALFAGVPVIASDWKYNREVIQDGYTGFIHRVKDIDDLKEKLVQIYSNPTQWNEMKINCTKAAENYSYLTVGRQICDALNSVQGNCS